VLIMGERKFEVKTFGVDYICDDCNSGLMEYTGTMLTVNPPLFQHKCNSCGSVKNLSQKYPNTIIERVPS